MRPEAPWIRSRETAMQVTALEGFHHSIVVTGWNPYELPIASAVAMVDRDGRTHGRLCTSIFEKAGTLGRPSWPHAISPKVYYLSITNAYGNAMRPRLLVLACLGAIFCNTVHAQSASDALRAAWQQICPDATPGTELFARCAEIRDSGPGSADRELAAANGNNLELLATQGRMVMATVKQRARRAQSQARHVDSTANLAWSPWLAAADTTSSSGSVAEGDRWALIASAGSGTS